MTLFAEYEPLRHGALPPEGLTTRPATRGDLQALAAIRAERDGMAPEMAAAIFSRQVATAHAGRAHLLLAALGDAPVGYGVVEWLAIPGLPEGWYLSGVVVSPAQRRRGIGMRLTRERLDWVASRDRRAYYFVNEGNRASRDLHGRFGFRELVRGIEVPGLTFTGGVGLLFGADLPVPEPS